jgi:hypothetical protein
MFTHEKFEAYQLAIPFTRLALQCLDEMPRGSAHLRDQLRRAAFSVSLNIAEGTGKNGRSDRGHLRHYRNRPSGLASQDRTCQSHSQINRQYSLNGMLFEISRGE